MRVESLVALAAISALASGSIVGLTYTMRTPSPAYVLLARPYTSTNVFVLDHGLTLDDCALALDTLTPLPMVELEPGNAQPADAIHLSCALNDERSDF